jgi:hypothetical protein
MYGFLPSSSESFPLLTILKMKEAGIFRQTRHRFPEDLNLKWKGMEYALQH